jgi:hypothetical protein
MQGVWIEGIHCPPSACTLKQEQGANFGDTITACANDGYSVGDYCIGTAGSVVCSTDLSKILSCQDGRTVVNRDCGARKCTSVATSGSQPVLDCR